MSCLRWIIIVLLLRIAHLPLTICNRPEVAASLDLVHRSSRHISRSRRSRVADEEPGDENAKGEGDEVGAKGEGDEVGAAKKDDQSEDRPPKFSQPPVKQLQLPGVILRQHNGGNGGQDSDDGPVGPVGPPPDTKSTKTDDKSKDDEGSGSSESSSEDSDDEVSGLTSDEDATRRERKRNAKRAARYYGYLVAITLLSFLVFCMYLLYMTQNSDPQLSAYSYKTVSLAIGIFLAVMLEISQHHLLVLGLVHLTMDLDSLSHHRADLYIEFFLFIMWYFLITACAYACRHCEQNLEVVKVVIMHLGVFVAISFFGESQEAYVQLRLEEYSHRATAYLLFPFFVLVFCKILETIAKIVKEKLIEADAKEGHTGEHGPSHESVHDGDGGETHGHGHGHGHDGDVCHGHGDADVDADADGHGAEAHDGEVCHGHGEHDDAGHGAHGDEHGEHHHHPHWVHIAVESEVEFSGLLFGFLMGRAIAFICTHRVQSADFEDGFVPAEEGSGLRMFVAVLITLFIFLGTTKLGDVLGHANEELAEYIEVHAQFLFTWTWVNWTRLVITFAFHEPGVPLHQKSLTIEKAYMAFVMAPVLIFGMFFIDFAGDRNIINDFTANEIIESIGLFTALLWEATFDCSIEAVADLFQLPKFQHHLMVGTIGLFLVVSILPAWKWYVVPLAIKPVPKRDELPSSPENGHHH
eukprot:TRINITY_DN4192_c0_g2_i1.p1 TRINITY_DN4192_c0_g2~~TRINITY_DN4192_c0_g2_i1.p1  ORF type:complete len:694 (+),score=68.71 TRINITY_DN4192_c0_g2_i1:61-2142(+)